MIRGLILAFLMVGYIGYRLMNLSSINLYLIDRPEFKALSLKSQNCWQLVIIKASPKADVYKYGSLLVDSNNKKICLLAIDYLDKDLYAALNRYFLVISYDLIDKETVVDVSDELELRLDLVSLSLESKGSRLFFWFYNDKMTELNKFNGHSQVIASSADVFHRFWQVDAPQVWLITGKNNKNYRNMDSINLGQNIFFVDNEVLVVRLITQTGLINLYRKQI